MDTDIDAQPAHPAPRRVLSARSVIRHPDGHRLLLLRRSPRSSTHPGAWEFPGGKPDPGEDIGDTLLRETREETGLEIHLGPVLGVADGPVHDLRVAYLFLDATCHSTTVVLDPAEHTDHQWATYTELAQLADLPQGDDPGLVPAIREFARDLARRRLAEIPPVPPDREPPATCDAGTLDQWVDHYRERRPRYEALGRVLQTLFETHARPLSPLATIEGRTKGLASFAGKILRRPGFVNPLAEITDLCGLRIVTQINAEVEAICRFIREARITPDGQITRPPLHHDTARPLFHIDEKHSEDKLDRLDPREFGYRSVHFIVTLDPRAFPPGSDRETLAPLKAEIQVRTQLQHAWASISHDRLYKAAFQPPARIGRESARVAALLEDADAAFTRLVEGLDDYECHYGSYLDPDQIQAQIQIQEDILKHDPRDPAGTLKLARLHLALDTPRSGPSAAAAVHRLPAASRTADLWSVLGDALRTQGGEAASPGIVRARDAYHRALQLQPGHPLAMVGLAQTAVSPPDRLAAWAAACRSNPDDPAALSGFIREKIAIARDPTFLPLLRPSLLAAIQRCRLQIEVAVDLPWALYRMAGFQLLLGEEGRWPACETLARAIHCHAAPLALLHEALAAAESLLAADPHWPGAEVARRMLLIALRVKHPHHPAAAPLETLGTGHPPLPRGPVVIIAGGCDPDHETRLAAYQTLFEASFADYHGTLLSGGTRQGISGLVGRLAEKARSGEPRYSHIHTVGYLPHYLPADGSATRDPRYHQIRHTPGTTGFSVLEPLQSWIDLLDAGIHPRDVRVVGINGGRIAGFEYLLAWALGARVALLRDSGRVADTFEAGMRHGDYPGMIVLPHDAMSLQAFLHQGGRHPSPHLDPDTREHLARRAHTLFLDEQRHRHIGPAMQPWEHLREDFKESNRSQIDHMVRHLAACGYRIQRIGPGESPFTFGPADQADIETMARAEHGRWNVERLLQGWRFGPVRDPGKRLHPGLVPWEELDEPTRQWDRNAVRRYPRLLAEAGFAICRAP